MIDLSTLALYVAYAAGALAGWPGGGGWRAARVLIALVMLAVASVVNGLGDLTLTIEPVKEPPARAEQPRWSA